MEEGEENLKISARDRKAQELVFSRQRSYLGTFTKDSMFVKEVLEDLARFCRADETTFHENARLHAVLEGRREVWLRIQDHIKLTSHDLWEKIKRRN